jgi:16S rRNA (cytidine1402-2'-O)-methyltransferase
MAKKKKTTVMFESSHRILKLLNEIIEIAGENRMLSVSRELTKKFEETQTGTVREVLTHFESKPEYQKGEFVVVLGLNA